MIGATTTGNGSAFNGGSGLGSGGFGTGTIGGGSLRSGIGLLIFRVPSRIALGAGFGC
jgi:hypothetical protein